LVPFTRTEWDAQHKWRGVSPWEITTRIEPVVMLNGGHDAAVLLALGAVYNFFPDSYVVRMTESGDGKVLYSAKPREPGFLSSTVRRMGLRVGVGGTLREEADLVAGAAVQLWKLDLWYLYDAGESESVLAVGMSDWDWIKKALPFFGIN
jgi:hypothetical protein